MSLSAIIALSLLLLISAGFYLGRRRALGQSGGRAAGLHSLPNFYGYYIAIWTGLPALLLLAGYGLFGTQLVNGLTIAELERQGAALTARYESRLAADPEHAAALAEIEAAGRAIAGMTAEIDGLRAAEGEARDPDRLDRLEAERSENRTARAAAETRAAERAEALVAEIRAAAPEDFQGVLERAGFEYAISPSERQQLLLVDTRRIAEGRLASRVTPELRAAAGVLTPIEARFDLLAVLAAITLALAGLVFAARQVRPGFRARNHVERLGVVLLQACSVVAILTTLGIVLSLLFESLRFFSEVSVFEFIFGLHWSPQTAMRADQVGQTGGFGAAPLFLGTAVITVVAMFVAVPIGLFSAIFLSEYASPGVRRATKPVLEILAGVPTVVYGLFAIQTVGPFVRELAVWLGFEDTSTRSALSAGVVMGVMIIPFVSSLADDIIHAVPRSLRDGAYAMGATKSETIRSVVLPAALPGIVGAVLLAVSRAIGETMIVLMAAGQGAPLTINPLESLTTVTVWIVTLIVGDQEFESAKTLSAFALGLVLFIITLALNIIALRVVQKHREKYE